MSKSIDLIMSLKDNVSNNLGTVNKNLSDTSGKLKATNKSLIGLGSTLKGLFIGGALAGIASETLKAYDTQIKAEKSVTRALVATGETASQAKSELSEWKEFASKQQDITAFGDEATLNVISGLISQGFGKDSIKAIVSYSQDIARSTGEEQENVTKALATYIKTGKGAAKLSKEYGLNADLLGKGATQAERQKEVWDALSKSKHLGAATEYMKTFEGQLANVKGRFDDLKEPVGELISTLLGGGEGENGAAKGLNAFANLISETTADIQAMATHAEELGGGFTGVGVAALEAHPAVVSLMTALAASEVVQGLNSTITAVRGIAGAIGALNVAVKGLLGPIGLAIAAITALIELGQNYMSMAPEVRYQLDETQRAAEGTYAASAVKGSPDMSKTDWGDSPWGAKNANANGTSYFKGGRTIVGEYGPEIVDLPRGSVVKNNAQTKRELSGNGYTINCPVTIQGNVVGNDDFIEQIGTALTSRVQLAISNM